MIFINDEKVKDYSPYYKVLSKVFPNSFTETGVKAKAPALEIKVREDRRGGKVVVFRQGNLEEPVGTKEVELGETRLATRGTIRTDSGVSDTWVYTTQAPKRNKDGSIEYTPARLGIKESIYLDCVADIDKIIVLYFFSHSVVNNAIGNISGKFRFVIASEEARPELEKIRLQNKYSSLLIAENGAISDEKFSTIYTLLGYYPTESIEVDRLSLYNLCLRDLSVRQAFDRHLQSLNAESKGDTLSDVGDLVKEVKERNILTREDGYWVVKDVNGNIERKVCEVKGERAAMHNNLVEFVKASVSDYDYLKSKLV